ncbi:unnamed protein product [Cuscuta epithymum]|uniref:Uncharacterized protein n=1 Tax=Cuscuta epithymum TaxID=186058 RepID=A0AAV0C994_9ASTE|nr:unnamed protein product [Cuscuta epithymum]
MFHPSCDPDFRNSASCISMCGLALSCYIMTFLFDECGHLALIAGSRVFMNMSLITCLVTLNVGLVSKVPAGLFLLDLLVVSSYVNGKIPISPSHSTSPLSAILGLPTAVRNIILGKKFLRLSCSKWIIFRGKGVKTCCLF